MENAGVETGKKSPLVTYLAGPGDPHEALHWMQQESIICDQPQSTHLQLCRTMFLLHFLLLSR
jgi:hypothetical protein